MKLPFERALLLSPHVDDIEYGMGGTFARLMDEGVPCFVIAFSVGNSEDGSSVYEFTRSMERFGCDEYVLHDYLTRQFGRFRQNILDELIELCWWNPDVVFVPCTGHVHQDHQVITQEAIRAYRDLTVLGYESPWNEVNTSFDRRLFVDITGYEGVKTDALFCYESQIKHRHSRSDPDRALDLASVRGMQSGLNYAEAFEVIRWIIKGEGGQ